MNKHWKYKFTADQRHNMDETGSSTVHKPPKVIAPSRCNHKQKEGFNYDMHLHNAGKFVPPMWIIKGSRLNGALKKGAPPNMAFGCSKNRWITFEIFVE
ncbi:hypothetical protein JTB14_010823 [Gonioctena quinquepunctata]|nr:hypothetical protein JTB14_010823 [Gonioctena quinquepunctata]